jgi:uncharacterized membrane protein
VWLRFMICGYLDSDVKIYEDGIKSLKRIFIELSDFHVVLRIFFSLWASCCGGIWGIIEKQYTK